MQRYRMTLAYDGTDYAGWQVQPNGVTIQEHVEKALAQLTGERTKVHGSGRTDQGVHARAQVAHFDLERVLARTAIVGLNALLPADIRVARLHRAQPDFHARRSACGKEYRYFICDGPVVPPFVRRYRTHVKQRLDAPLMRLAAARLVGQHDFAAFTANPNRVVESTVRRLDRLDVRRRGSEVTVVAAGDGFLYRMVRSIAGWLIRVGAGDVPPAQTVEVLASLQRTARVPTAPAQGLFLWRVMYR